MSSPGAKNRATLAEIQRKEGAEKRKKGRTIKKEGSFHRLVPLQKEVVRSNLLWELASTYLQNEPPAIMRSIVDHVEYSLARTPWSFNTHSGYYATALSVRDRLLEYFNDTQRCFYEKKCKRVYYLSIEYLMGRLLLSNLQNMGIRNAYAEALRQLGWTLEDIAEQEVDAGLGNGGLGRLAACYMESLATLNIPAWGYGLRYNYGMFRQKISPEGEQTELPDYWLAEGFPWEVERNDVKYPVRFRGSVREIPGKGPRGTTKYIWEGGDEVIAKAYDIPVPGYDTYNTIALRLWASRPSQELDLGAFNQGNYYDALRAKQQSEEITSVLYPNDNTTEGKELRLKQQYFFVAATLQDIMRRFKKSQLPLSEFHTQAAIQLNDTHPTLAIPELMRLLVDIEGVPWDEAWRATTQTFSFTNHTVLPEALEKWPVSMIESLLPRHMQIIYLINWNFLEFVRRNVAPVDDALISRLSLIEEGPVRKVRMANLAVIGSHAINGVAELHSELLKSRIFQDFYRLWPDRFCNVTNGVTNRRWLLEANEPQAQLFTELVGNGTWVTDMNMLKTYVDRALSDPMFCARWQEGKLAAKVRLAHYLGTAVSVAVDPHALFDVQVKRIHEYKRQHLNIFRVIHHYLRIKRLPEAELALVVPRVVIFGGKAAPGYVMAKRIIRLINAVAHVVNADAQTERYLKVVFCPNYNVSQAELIIPASDISQHISTAGLEASGTSNMKFAMNGGLLLGTLDGATIEIRDEVGPDNVFIFGETADNVERARAEWKAGRIAIDPRLSEVLDVIEKGMFGDPAPFKMILDAVRYNDYYLVQADFTSYLQAHEEVDRVWRDRTEWTRRSIMTAMRMGKFSSDRSISDYCRRIWNVEPCVLPTPLATDEARAQLQQRRGNEFGTSPGAGRVGGSPAGGIGIAGAPVRPPKGQ